ncbi:MAG: carboxypeptidase regulatory-like domain-containing protein [Planctomycetes bacterium]|nr:carboxypeptidase regulatory-like domain-containing protein [Planctomycetota bacterium]
MHRMARGSLLLFFAAAAATQDSGQVLVRGRVANAFGEPVPAARVTVRSAAGPVLRGTSDAEGVFLIPRVPIANASIQAEADGLASRPQWVWPGEHRNDLLTISMCDAAPFTGRVVDATGHAIPGAEVYLARRDFSVLADWEGRTITADDGSFSLAATPLGEVRVRVTASEGGVLHRRLSLPPDAGTTLIVPAASGRWLSVRLRTPQGDAVPGRKVFVHRPAAPDALAANTLITTGTTDDDGTFRMRLGRDEPVRVFPFPEEAESMEPTARQVAAGDDCELEFSVGTVTTVPLRGLLTDAHGSPLAHETVIVNSVRGGRHGQGATDARGQFTIAFPHRDEPGIQIFLIGSPNVLDLDASRVHGTPHGPTFTWRGSAVGDGAEIRLTARRGARLSGIAWLDDGEPAAFCDVEVFDAHTRARLAAGTTGPRGEFDLAGVASPGAEARIKIYGGVGYQIGEPIGYAPGEHVADIEVTTQRAAALQGRVVDGDGRAIAGVTVHCRPSQPDEGWSEHGGSHHSPVTDREGRFRVWLAPGTASVEVPGRVARQEVQVRRGEPNRIELVAARRQEAGAQGK